MKKLMVLTTILLSLMLAGNAFAFFELKNAKKAMSVGEYDEAIVLLKKVAKKGDIETNFQLGVAYLMHNSYDSKAADKFNIIANSKGYPDKIAKAYLNKIANCDNSFCIDAYLTEAEKYCLSSGIKRQIANKLMCMRVKNYKVRAARLIGEKEVFGFKRSWNGKVLTITLMVNTPVVVLDNWSKGRKIVFSGFEKKSNIKKKGVTNNIYYNLIPDSPYTGAVSGPLTLKGSVGDKICMKFI